MYQPFLREHPPIFLVFNDPLSQKFNVSAICFGEPAIPTYRDISVCTCGVYRQLVITLYAMVSIYGHTVTSQKQAVHIAALSALILFLPIYWLGCR